MPRKPDVDSRSPPNSTRSQDDVSSAACRAFMHAYKVRFAPAKNAGPGAAIYANPYPRHGRSTRPDAIGSQGSGPPVATPPPPVRNDRNAIGHYSALQLELLQTGRTNTCPTNPRGCADLRPRVPTEGPASPDRDPGAAAVRCPLGSRLVPRGPGIRGPGGARGRYFTGSVPWASAASW